MSELSETRTTVPVPAPARIQGPRGTLTRLPGGSSARPPVILTHGTFSNVLLCQRLGAFLQGRGFDCWLLEWPGHGATAPGGPELSYEQLALGEVEATVRAVRAASGRESVLWVGHSAGGVMPYIYLARRPEEARRFRGIVSMGSQTTHAGGSLRGRLKLAVGYLVTNGMGRAPGPVFRVGPDDESRRLMNQWFRWNWSGRWIGEDGFNYLEALREVRVPALCLAGAADDFIAPVEGCRRLFEALGSEDKTFLHCAKAEGFLEDYSHTRLIASSSSRAELWPRIAAWLGQHGEGRA